MNKLGILFNGLIDVHAQVAALIDLAANSGEIDVGTVRALSSQLTDVLAQHDAVDAPVRAELDRAEKIIDDRTPEVRARAAAGQLLIG